MSSFCPVMALVAASFMSVPVLQAGEDAAGKIEAAIKKYDGKITRDENHPDKPISTITFFDCPVDDAALKELGPQLASLKHLKELNLSLTKITDAGLKQLSALTRLEVLYLNKTQITDAGLADFPDLDQLQTLDLSHTATSDVGLKHLAHLK